MDATMIAEKIKDSRLKLGKTQYDIAKESGVTRSYYADVERGRYTPSLKLLSKLSNIMDIDLNFLREIDGNNDNDGNTRAS